VALCRPHRPDAGSLELAVIRMSAKTDDVELAVVIRGGNAAREK
jgi:hypothetical protein